MLESRLLLSSSAVVSTTVPSLQTEAASINADFVGANNWLKNDRQQVAQAAGLKTLSKTQLRPARSEISALQRAVNTAKKQIVADFKKLAINPTDADLQAQLDTARQAMWASQSTDQEEITSQLGANVVTSAASDGSVFHWIGGSNGLGSYNDPNSWDLGTVPGSADFAVMSSVSGASLAASSDQNVLLVVHSGALGVVGTGGVVSSTPIVNFDGNAPMTGIVTSSGVLNLISNNMIVTGLANGTVNAQLVNGFNSHTGYWNGDAGVISSSSATDTRHLTTLGFDNLNGTTGDVLVKYTYYGDADLSGAIIENGADYQKIDDEYKAASTGWTNGDFNYDGVVDGSDYTLVDNTYNQIAATGATPLSNVTGG